MKKIMVVIIALVFLGLSPQVFCQKSQKKFGIGADTSYYAVNDSMFKEVYSAGSMMFSVSLSTKLSNRFQFIATYKHFTAKGEMTFSKEEVTYTFTPIVAGLRYWIFDSRRIIPYLGAGIGFCSYKEKVPERFGGDITGSKAGFHGELGIYVKLTESVLIDINGMYLTLKVEPIEEAERDIGGFGAGIDSSRRSSTLAALSPGAISIQRFAATRAASTSPSFSA